MAIVAPDLGINLGTSNTQVYVKKKGIVISEPSMLVADRGGRHAVRASERTSSAVEAFGLSAA